MLKFFILCVSYFVAGSIAGVAPFIKPCRQTDSQCIVNSANLAMPYMLPGIEALGLPSIDPLVTHNITADTGDLKLAFTNIVVHNLGKCKINNIERDPEQSTGILDIDCPILCVGNYKFGGKLFFLDIEGEGPFEIKSDKLHVVNTIRLKQNTKGGKKHYKITGFDFKYEPIAKFSFKFENLFNGDRVKAEPIEKIFEQSWKEVILDLGQPVIKEVLVRLVDIIDKLFQKVPIEELEIV